MPWQPPVWDMTDYMEIYGEASYMRNQDTRQFLIPSAPGGSFIIPASHPGIPPALAAADCCGRCRWFDFCREPTILTDEFGIGRDPDAFI